MHPNPSLPWWAQETPEAKLAALTARLADKQKVDELTREADRTFWPDTPPPTQPMRSNGHYPTPRKRKAISTREKYHLHKFDRPRS